MNESDRSSSRYVVINEGTGEARERAAPPVTPVAPSEAVRRVEVADEDRLAFRVGVNLLVLLILGVAGYLLWRNFLG